MTSPLRARIRARRRWLALLVLPLAAAFLPVPAQPSLGAGALGPVSVTKAVSRVHLEDGADVVADQRTVTIKVDQTQQLHDREAIDVTWSGARPTSNIVADPTSHEAADEEFPFVLMECRGVDSASVPLTKRLRPETCWSQTPNERYASSSTLQFPPWRVDRYAAKADRKRNVGTPHPLPKSCSLSGYPDHWLHFVSVTGADYAGGPISGCAGIAPEQSTAGATASLPGNTTYGVTGPDGTGQAKFIVWTSLTNASLGCGPTVPCALVAVPIEGISCDVAAAGLPAIDRPTGDDATAAESACTSNGGGSVPSLAVAGRLWWSASNWRNRITIPLGFAPLPVTSCSTSAGGGVQVYGSELMTAATLQWGSKFCEDSSLFPLTHVQTGEPEARNLLTTGNTDAAFTTDVPPGGWGSPVVTAPVAMTGFSVGYAIDDGHQHEYTQLRMTPRLLAKLLTESYPDNNAVRDGWAQPPDKKKHETDYRALANNPLNITQDPEFIALNPGVGERDSEHGAATMLMLSGGSDIVAALTSYINADPEARAWLNGIPDPWGMVVNPHYKGIKLPVDTWPLLDSYIPTDLFDSNICLKLSPTPWLQLVASPTIELSTISLDLQYAIQQSQVVCTNSETQNPKLAAVGLQRVGFRFIIGVTSLADALRYRINSAALQTRVDSSAQFKFTDATGRTFVAPTDASLRAAGKLLTPDSSTGAWTMPYGQFVGTDASKTAYPGAMLVSTAVPTQGLPAGEARDYSTFLKFAAGPGQTTGSAAGQLPPGYLPMTSANGLGAQAHYTDVAADYVAAQDGKVPSLDSPQPPPTAPSGTGGTPPSTSNSSSTPAPGGLSASTGGGPPLAAGSTPPNSTGAGSQPPSVSSSPAAATGRMSGASAGALGYVLPVLALLALGAGLAAPALSRFGVRRS